MFCLPIELEYNLYNLIITVILVYDLNFWTIRDKKNQK